jgi:hypothetical protein
MGAFDNLIPRAGAFDDLISTSAKARGLFENVPPAPEMGNSVVGCRMRSDPSSARYSGRTAGNRP